MVRNRSNIPKPLKDALKDFLDDYPHRKRLKRGMILSLWGKTVGSAIAEQTKKIYFENGRLVVHIPNAAWRHEIHMNRFSIAQKLNHQVGEKIIKEILVRS